MEFQANDRVWWNDPDNGVCSGVRTISKILDNGIIVLDDSIEVYAHELQLINHDRDRDWQLEGSNQW